MDTQIQTKSKLGFGGGTGLMEIAQFGRSNYRYTNFNEFITFSRPTVMAQNLVLGNLYVDFAGEVEVISSLGLKASIEFQYRGWTTESSTCA